MKRIYLLLAGTMCFGLSFGQVNPTKSSPFVSGGPVKATTPSKAVSTGGLSETDPAFSSPAGPATSGSTSPTMISGPSTSTSGSTSPTMIAGPSVATPAVDDHFCPTHTITMDHYESMGMSEAEYNAAVAEGIAASAGMSGMKTPGTNTIAVIFHVVHDAGDALGVGTNVSNAAIMNVYNDLVEDFSLTNADAALARTGTYGFTPHNPEINFCLATQDEAGTPLAEIGVIRVPTTEDWYDSDGGETNKMKSSTLPSTGSDIWDRNKYLNVWICDISNGAGSGTAGYAYKPTPTLLPNSSIDGIVLDYNLGVVNDNVLTHEVGHYLGLDHTWGGSGGCGSDDGFTDTPNTAGPSFDYSGSCTGFQETCPSTQTQYENYMDYANCTVMFTEDQSDYMMLILTTLRSSLMLSSGCDPTAAPPNSSFTSIPLGPSPVIIPESGGVNFIDESTNVPSGWAWTISGIEGTDWDWSAGSASTDQNPSATFYNAGFYDVQLTASNIYGADATPADSIGYVQVVVPAVGLDCDTLRDYNPLTEGASGYILDGLFGPPWEDWGYLPGHGGYDFLAATTGASPLTRWAERYTYTGTAEVRRLRIPVLLADDVTGTGEVRYSIHADGATPGVELVQDTVLIADLLPGFWNELDFSNPTSVTGSFWVVFEFDYGASPATQDTVLFYTVNFADRDATTGINDLYVETNAGTWYQTTDLWGGYETSLYMDVLLSNGPPPTASFTWSEAEICAGGDIVVNGSGSTNVTDYFWNQWDPGVPTSLGTSTAPGATFNFPTAGAYEIYLFADGSCMTDGVFLPVTINPPVGFSVNITHTTCGFNNGILDVTGETGGDGTYEYSIDGTTWGASPTFSGLPAGTYTVYVRTDGDNCESQLGVTINPSTEFVAGISPNIAICPGDNTDLTATGGASYEWFDGATSLGTTPTINVSPSITTTYLCVVVDGSSCESNVEVTVTVDPLDDASFVFFDFCFGAANGATSIATPGGTFTFFDDPTASASIDGATGEISLETIFTTYIVQYDVAVGCANSSTVSVTVSDVDDPSFVTSDFCEGDVNVVSSIATTGGVFSYDIVDASSINSSTGVITGGVLPTTYTIKYVTPVGICQDSSTVAITVQPNPVISATTEVDPLCNGDATGSIDITVTGATPTGFDWGAFGTTEDLTSLGAGTYDVTVDAGVCSTTGSYTLTDPPLLVIDSVNTTDILCNGDTDGTAVTFATGGTPGLTYDYGGEDENNLGAGLFTVTVTDANGCSTNQNFTIIEPTAIGATATTTMDDGTSSGSIDLTPTGGVPPYTYAWDNAETTEDITGLPAGDYEVTITDANGCVFVITFTVPSSVGIGDEEIINGMTLYPNPTSGQFTIAMAGEYALEITDARGRLILEKSGSEETLIDLSSYERGVYMIRVQKDGGSVVKRLVKK